MMGEALAGRYCSDTRPLGGSDQQAGTIPSCEVVKVQHTRGLPLEILLNHVHVQCTMFYRSPSKSIDYLTLYITPDQISLLQVVVIPSAGQRCSQSKCVSSVKLNGINKHSHAHKQNAEMQECWPPLLPSPLHQSIRLRQPH